MKTRIKVEASPPINLAPYNHGRLGYCNDLDGHSTILPRPSHCTPVPRRCRSWALSRCRILHNDVVLSTRRPAQTSSLLQRCQHCRSLLRPSSICDREDGWCWWVRWVAVDVSLLLLPTLKTGPYDAMYSFILEGIATVLVAISAFFVLHDFPDTASFLTIEERAWVVHRLKYQGSAGSTHNVAETEGFKWKYVKAAFTDWQIYVALWVCPPFYSLNPR